MNMRYVAFRKTFEPFIVFSLSDIRKVEPSFDNRRIVEWQEKGYIKKLIRGYYIFSDRQVTDVTLYYIANYIYTPSYVSLEMGLSYYNIIPESVYAVTSISSKKTQEFMTSLGRFRYQSVKKSLMFGYRLVPYEHVMIKMGELEKVLLDYLYLHAEIMAVDDLDALRFNREVLAESMKMQRLEEYLTLFSSKTLMQRVKILYEYIESHNATH